MPKRCEVCTNKQAEPHTSSAKTSECSVLKNEDTCQLFGEHHTRFPQTSKRHIWNDQLRCVCKTVSLLSGSRCCEWRPQATSWLLSAFSEGKTHIRRRVQLELIRLEKWGTSLDFLTANKNKEIICFGKHISDCQACQTWNEKGVSLGSLSCFAVSQAFLSVFHLVSKQPIKMCGTTFQSKLLKTKLKRQKG